MSENRGTQSSLGEPPTVGAMAILLLLCLIWAATVAIKISSRGFEPIFAATLRSIGAGILLRSNGLITRQHCGSKARLKYAIAVGLFFAAWNISSCSRAPGHARVARTVHLYTSPFWVALGRTFSCASDSNLSRWESAACLRRCAGRVRRKSRGARSTHLLGDFMEIVGAVFWASETLLARRQ
jgi:drug/metabolite transporter (DMT)-like permease